MSANLLTQVTFEGLDDPYFFAKDFTNHPEVLKEGGNQCRFQTTDRRWRHFDPAWMSTGVGHLARWREA